MAFSTIQGSGSAPDSFVGTSGVDQIVLINEAGPLFVGAQPANDIIQYTVSNGTGLNYTIRGGQGNDIIQDVSANGVILVNGFINANNDADTITASVSNGTVFGGQGSDTLTIAFASASSRVNGNRDNDTINATTLTTSSVFGGQGNDNVTVSGSIDRSTIQGDLDNDTIVLGNGANAVSFTSSVVNGNAGTDNISVAAGGFATAAGSSVFGGQGNDTLTFTTAGAAVLLSGDDGNDSVTGGGGNDTLNGGEGGDQIVANNGNDIAIGDAGNDNLNGGGGNDTITGGTGTDLLTGGTGTDRFAYTANDQTLVTNTTAALSTADIITDFTTAQTDVISFAAGLAAGGGNLAFGTTGATLAATFNANTVNVVSLDTTTVAAATQGAAAANSNAALIIINSTGTNITSGANTIAGLIATSGLQVIGIQGVAGQNNAYAAANFVLNA